MPVWACGHLPSAFVGFWSWLGEALGFARIEFSAPKPIDQMFAELRGSGVAPRDGRTEALTVPAVQRGRNLLCSIATLPLAEFGPDRRVVRNPLFEQIDPNVANIVTLTQTVEDLVFEAIAWWRITAFAADGFPAKAMRLDPGAVSVDPPSGRSPAPLPSEVDPREGVVWVDGKPVLGRFIIRFDSPNPAVLKVGGRAIKRAILLDKAARMYADDPRALEYFMPAGDVDELDDDEIEEFLADWAHARRQRSTAYVPAAVKHNTVDSPTPADLQLVELQRQATLEIANAFGVDPEELGVSTTSRTYANAVDRRRDKINDVLAPFMRAITDRLSMGDVTKRGHTVGFDLDAYMQSNPTERWNVYKIGRELRVLARREIREKERLPEIDLAELDEDQAPAAAPAAGEDQAAEVDAGGVEASRRRVVGFDDPGTLRFADVPVTEFAVDTASRTIEGLALPYGRIGTKYGLKFRFERGALTWAADVGRVKLLRDHDHRQAIGKAVTLTDTPQGLKVRFKVAAGAAGDEALQLAADGVLDGLSVGVEFDLTSDTAPDPRNKGVLLVRRCDLREISLTAMPNFDDARVTKVAASRDGGTPMDECATCGHRHAPGTACPPNPASPPAAAPAPTPPAAAAPVAVTLDAERLGQLLAQQNGAQALSILLGNTPAPAAPAAPAAQRELVDATRVGPHAFVREPAPYRFDRKGNLRRGSHDFSTDLVAWKAGDQAAYDRAMEFVRGAFEDGSAFATYQRAMFDVATGDVNELNPARNRPDMYVDQRTFRYPIWETIDKGSLADITPFTFPKFNSAAGLVGAHTEGVEPSSGSYTTTSQTVTPTANSGKAKITRETWDQGGNPQVSNLLWRQMVKGWFEALEAAAVAVLDAASPTQIDFSGTPGLADEQLDQALTDKFVDLQFVRGGFSMDAMFSQIDFFKALARATDSAGRRLYPALGPTNTTGTARARWSALDLNGITALPAWALAATGTVAASSYLFDSEAVHGWASTPQRLDISMIEVAHVYIGLWGYKATAISDLNGVREIVYDPA